MAQITFILTNYPLSFAATFAVLKELKKESIHSKILATTLKENVHSIQLLEKLGFHFETIIQREAIELFLYVLQKFPL